MIINNKQCTVIFDCDDVVLNLRDRMQSALTLYTGTDIPWEKWEYFHLPYVYPELSIMDIQAALIEHEAIENCKPEPGIHDVFELVSSLGFDIKILTARGWHPNAYQITTDSLNDAGLLHYISEISIVPLQQCKSETVRRYNTHTFAIVEDNHDNLNAISPYVDHSFLIDRPWNRKALLCPNSNTRTTLEGFNHEFMRVVEALK